MTGIFSLDHSLAARFDNGAMGINSANRTLLEQLERTNKRCYPAQCAQDPPSPVDSDDEDDARNHNHDDFHELYFRRLPNSRQTYPFYGPVIRVSTVHTPRASLGLY